MKWSIVYSKEARDDLKKIYEYIAYQLLSPRIAEQQVNRIMTTIRTLDEMPLRYRRYQEEPWYSKGIRFVPINNYLIFYMPDESDSIVNIVRIIYSGRDIKEQINGNS